MVVNLRPASGGQDFMKNIYQIPFFLFLLLAFLCNGNSSTAQCTSVINSFPYTEDFEASNGNWTRSSNVHWEWGTITPGSKSVITAAASGQKCWIVGGLSGASYNSGNSYLTSPCFDFTTLVNPEISMKIFWETERDFDGVHVQYSTDQGVNWLLLGDQNSNGNCQAVNWYNLASVRFLGFIPGWSGNIQTGGPSNCTNGLGSRQWLLAKHNVSFLAGQSRVIFRYVFGAGTICNNYEGFAVDDIKIAEAPAASASFDYNCQGNNTVAFTNTSSPCQSSVLWDFDDPASGGSNASNLNNPDHTFSAPGVYDVRITVTFTNAPPATTTRRVIMLSVSPAITNNIDCNGDQDGAITATVSGGLGGYNFSWNTNPVQNTPSISGLSGNTYTVTVTATDACTVSSSVTLIEPPALVISPQITPATCGRINGAINSNVTGGTLSYTYLWSNSETTNNIQNLAAGNYDLQVTDNNGCTAVANGLVVPAQTIPANINLGGDTTICPGQRLILRPGTFASYRWQDNSTAATFEVTSTGEYYVEVENTAGCKGSDTINVTVDCRDIYFPSSFTPDGNGKNDSFGPVGDLGSIRNFNMVIFNRWGQIVFASTNPLIKWNGTYKGKNADLQTFVWKANYRLGGGKIQEKKGTVMIIR